MKVISFVNIKGGVGKTTMAYLLLTTFNYFLSQKKHGDY